MSDLLETKVSVNSFITLMLTVIFMFSLRLWWYGFIQHLSCKNMRFAPTDLYKKCFKKCLPLTTRVISFSLRKLSVLPGAPPRNKYGLISATRFISFFKIYLEYYLSLYKLTPTRMTNLWKSNVVMVYTNFVDISL